MKPLITFLSVLTLYTHCALAQIASDQQPKRSTGPQFNFIHNDRIQDFGGIEVNSNASYEFYFKNSGNRPLVIKEMHSSPTGINNASCKIKISYPKKPIKPGKKGVIAVLVTAQNDGGSFQLEILVSSNATTESYPLLYITGAVIPEKGKYEGPKIETSGFFEFLTPIIINNSK